VLEIGLLEIKGKALLLDSPLPEFLSTVLK
jgi:hypothetical protein